MLFHWNDSFPGRQGMCLRSCWPSYFCVFATFQVRVQHECNVSCSTSDPAVHSDPEPRHLRVYRGLEAGGGSTNFRWWMAWMLWWGMPAATWPAVVWKTAYISIIFLLPWAPSIGILPWQCFLLHYYCLNGSNTCLEFGFWVPAIDRSIVLCAGRRP